MKRIFSRHALNVFQLKLEEWPYGAHTHNFYELIFVNEGTGNHCLNESLFRYGPGHIFLLTPDDYHSFEIETFTVFTYVKFTEQLFAEKQFGAGYLPRTKKFSELLYNPNTVPECIIKDQGDKKGMFSLAEMLLKEFNEPKSHSRDLMLELFGALMVLVARNLSKKDTNTHKPDPQERDKVQRLLSHIRQNIDKKELISQKYLSDTFGISPNYIGNYLKKHTGMGLQQMVNETRLKTAERLLKQSSLTISQIAEKVGFNDASHMNKMFLKHRNATPGQLRGR